jgi:hypothetical protein
MYRRRTISRRARVEFPADVDSLANLVAAPEEEVPTELHGLTAALGRIPEAQQRAIVLREWYGLSYREVAVELGVSASTAETLIFRARRRLAEELGGPAPISRRRRPLSLASPLASLKCLLGGGATVKALVGATSVVVLTVSSAKVGLLRLPVPGLSAPAPAAQRLLVVARPDARVPQFLERRAAVTVALPVPRLAGPSPRQGAAPAPPARATVPVVAADPADAPAVPAEMPVDPSPDPPAANPASPEAEDPAEAPPVDVRTEAEAEAAAPAPVDEVSAGITEVADVQADEPALVETVDAPAVTEPVVAGAEEPGHDGGPPTGNPPGPQGGGPGDAQHGNDDGNGNGGVGSQQGNGGVGSQQGSGGGDRQNQGGNGVPPQPQPQPPAGVPTPVVPPPHGPPAPHGAGSENGGQDLQ